MQIEYKNPNELIPYEFNNKLHDETQVNRIANSIKEFWFTQPVVIDKNNILIIWHWRLEAAKKLGIESIPTLQMNDLTETQVKKLRILDNKLNEIDYDLANLKLELEGLPDLNFWDLTYSVSDIFPEFDAPEFNPDDYDMWEWFSWDWELKLTVFAKDEAEMELIRKDLDELWYRYK